MTEPTAFTAKDGGLWVFPEGPNHPAQYIGCTDSDDIASPQGTIDLIRCFDPNGNYKVVGQKINPPDPVTSTLTSLTFKTRTWLERNRGIYGLAFLSRDGGRADTFTNWQRALILKDVRNTSKTYGAPVKREEDAEVTRAFEISATPPVIECVEVEGGRKTTTNPYHFNDVAMLPTDVGILPVKEGVAVADAGGVAKAQVWVTHDGGDTWANTAAQPFAITTDDIVACAIVDMGNNLHRLIVSLRAPAGAQGKTSYSDDDGATWHSVNLGGAAAGHGCTHGGGIFALDEHHVWLCSAAGYIYFSSDAGETWTAVESGIATAGDYAAIKFTADGLNGFAVAEAGIVVSSTDGGLNWAVTGASIAAVPDLFALDVRSADFVWVGGDTGGIWFSEDGGDTWTQRTGWIGSGVGVVNGIAFANDYCGFMICDNATPHGKVYRTIDGGYTWQAITSAANDGLTALFVGDENYALYTGLISTALGFLGLVAE